MRIWQVYVFGLREVKLLFARKVKLFVAREKVVGLVPPLLPPWLAD